MKTRYPWSPLSLLVSLMSDVWVVLIIFLMLGLTQHSVSVHSQLLTVPGADQVDITGTAAAETVRMSQVTASVRMLTLARLLIGQLGQYRLLIG